MFACLPHGRGAQQDRTWFRSSAESGNCLRIPDGAHRKGRARGLERGRGFSVAGGRVLAQTSSDQTDYRFPLAIYDRVNARNVEVTVRFKPVAGRIDRAGGIAVRLADADNYYVVRANALEDNVNFYRVVQGSRREIHGVGAKVTSDQWHTLSIKAEGDRFTIGFDGGDAVHRKRSDIREGRQGRAVDQGRQRDAIRRPDDPDRCDN